jgi:hypothetical protein
MLSSPSKHFRLNVISFGTTIAPRTSLRKRLGTMRLSTAAPKHFRVRSLTVIVFILALPVCGWTQQAHPPDQKRQPAARPARTIEYRNGKYGFSLTLPESWRGYRLLWSEWGGSVFSSDGTVTHDLRGPKLQIRHPGWTEENPREDLPIMIYTIGQWNESPLVSAAPFGPAELGRNRKYVFAVPPRWDYDLAEGWEEAQRILAPGCLHTFAPAD